MLKKLLSGAVLKDVGNILQVLKDNKGRFSSKRTVAGALVVAGMTFIKKLDPASITVVQIALPAVCFIVAGAIVLFAPAMESKSEDKYPDNPKN